MLILSFWVVQWNLWENHCRGLSTSDWWACSYPWGSLENAPACSMGYLEHHKIQCPYFVHLSERSCWTWCKKHLLPIPPKKHSFCSNELRHNSLMGGLTLLKGVLPKSEGHRVRSLECYAFKDIRYLYSTLYFRWKNWSPEEKRLPKTAQRISAELDSEFRAYHPLGRAPFWVIGLCSPILGIWYISLCIIVSLKAISWEKKGISSLKILALPYERGFVYWRPVLSLRFLTVILGSIKQGNRVCTLAR